VASHPLSFSGLHDLEKKNGKERKKIAKEKKE
jgi:hypothetical protein